MTKHAQIVFNGIHCFDPASRANLQAGTDPGQSMTNKKHKLYASRRGWSRNIQPSQHSALRSNRMSTIERWSGVNPAQLFSKHMLSLLDKCVIFSLRH